MLLFLAFLRINYKVENAADWAIQQPKSMKEWKGSTLTVHIHKALGLPQH